LHNGWFAELNRRLSELIRKPEGSDDDPPGDDVSDDTELDDDGRYSARQVPEEGDI